MAKANKKERIAILIKKASLEAEKIQIPILQKYDLSVAQYKFLRHLYSAKENVRIADLEKDFSMSHAAVIDILKVLEKKGYTTRKENPEDARSKIVALTKKAYDQQEELKSLSNKLEAAVTKNLNSLEKENLASLLHKMMGT